MNTHNTLKLIALAGLSFSMTMLPMGCVDSDKDSATAAHEGHDDHSGHDHGDTGDHDGDMTSTDGDLYENILGEITAHPGEDGSMLKIHHQQIPTFKNKEGIIQVNARGVAGMGSMTMEFPLSEGVNIDALKVGDKVKFDLLVNWAIADGLPYNITQIEKIDAGTEIDYSNAIEDIIDAAEDAIDGLMGDDHSGHGHDHDAP